ncbi:MAG: hypothetical protein GY762_07105 [Proteobacteria bacterium]|nr:hypothetical protein [Pseudomonadota bacterium]
MQVKVRKPHRSNYPNPIKFQRGERVRIGQADTKYGGWIWTTVGSGNSGWAPLQLLELEGNEAVALSDYDARELNTEPGQILSVLNELNNWYQVRTADGTIGWIPVETVDDEP